MGLCVSSQDKNDTQNEAIGRKERPNNPMTIGRPLTIKVINLEGRLQEYKQPIKTSQVTNSTTPRCFLGSSESMSIGTCVPHVPDDEELQPYQIYFLLPASQAHRPLTLHDLCFLAVKASSALGQESVDFFSSDSSMLIFR